MPVRAITWLLLLAVALAGVAHVAVLPPFEGYDETAHFSYVQQLADTGHIPVYGQDRLSADIDAYPGPRAAASGQPYRDFFKTGAPSSAMAEAGPTHYRPGTAFNWQAQHPPLYYVAMVLPYRLLSGLSWPAHLFGLRLAGWAMGFAGFAWGALVTQRLLLRRGIRDARLLVPIAWPLLFPEFFPELARLTNDSLCILLLACVWWLVLGWLERGGNWLRALALGVVLGAGLLTKAFFLPVAAGVTVLLLFSAMQQRARQHWIVTACVPLVAVLLGGAWYLAKWRTTGSVIGSADLIELRAHGGLLQGLRTHFSTIQYLRGVGGIIAGFCWAGTWSFVLPSRLFLLPLALLAVVPLCLYALRLRWRDRVALAPACIVAPVVAGLLYHLLATLAETGVGNITPGWYLHIFAAPLSLALVLGWPGRRVMAPLAGYALAFSGAMAGMQLAFFSGCLPRDGLDKVSLLAADCLIDVARLRVLAEPDIGLAALAASVLAVLLAVTLLLRPRTIQAGAL